MPLRTRTLVLILILLTLVACGGYRDDPILELSAQEALDQGKELMTQKKYNEARKYLIHAYEVEPNSVNGREGLLLAADALYFEGGESNFIEAESRYRDFLNRFPTSDQAAYAQFQIARCLSERMEKPNRDQSTAHKALAAFDDLLRLYPTSPYSSEARQEKVVVIDNLAEHEFVVGSFYLRYGIAISAISRFEKLLENFPDYTQKDKVLFHLCRAYDESEQPETAATTCQRLRREYPDSRYANRISRSEKKDAKADVEDRSADLAADGL